MVYAFAYMRSEPFYGVGFVIIPLWLFAGALWTVAFIVAIILTFRKIRWVDEYWIGIAIGLATLVVSMLVMVFTAS